MGNNVNISAGRSASADKNVDGESAAWVMFCKTVIDGQLLGGKNFRMQELLDLYRAIANLDSHAHR